MALVTFAVVFCLIVKCSCVQLGLFKVNARMPNASTIEQACSLTECAARFVNDKNSRAFSFYEDGNICELSARLPEDSLQSNGWKVYSTTDAKYYTSDEIASFEKAKITCENMSARLVIIDDESEQKLLESFIGADMYYWIGLICSGKTPPNCTWIDGRPVEGGYTNWYPGRPGSSYCVYLRKDGNTWADDQCNLLIYYICEYF